MTKNKNVPADKKLIKRVKSLEEFFGLAYVPSDEVDGYDQHLANESWGLAKRFEKIEERIGKMEEALGLTLITKGSTPARG